MTITLEEEAAVLHGPCGLTRWIDSAVLNAIAKRLGFTSWRDLQEHYSEAGFPVEVQDV